MDSSMIPVAAVGFLGILRVVVISAALAALAA